LRESGGGGFSAAYHPVVVEPDAMPTIEALEAERRRLKELERNLAAERDRIQESAAREIARLQAALRDAAERAGKRERELESTQRKLERKGQGRRLAVFGTLSAAKRRSPGGSSRSRNASGWSRRLRPSSSTRRRGCVGSGHRSR
jgi:septal ring factor EnvC (AmiA/AmiB activator)